MRLHILYAYTIHYEPIKFNWRKGCNPRYKYKDIECLPIYSNESPYVKRYGDIVLPFIKTILSNSLENARLAKMRDTLLPQLMSGELKISE